MAVDHLLFNNQSWYSIAGNADNATVNGKKYYAVPSKVTIKQGAYVSPEYNGGVLGQSAEVECVAASDSYYYFVGQITLSNGLTCTYTEARSYDVGRVAKSDCTNIVW